MHEHKTDETSNFKREEEQLKLFKATMTELPVPMDRLDDAIIAGIKRGNQQNTSHHLWKRSGLVAAILLILFTSSIRVSDTFAAYVTKIPGLEKVVELVRFDKGLSDAIEHEYMQSYDNLTVEHDGLKVTIDSIIADEKQMFVFYTLESSEDHRHVWTDSISLTDSAGNDVLAAISYGGERENLQDKKAPPLNRMDVIFKEPLDVSELHVTMQLKEGSSFAADDAKSLAEEWEIVIPINQTEIAKKRIFHVNETVEVEGQKITIQQITMYPTRVAVLVAYDPNNTKEIFDVEDMRLVNERGESRTTIADGIMASHVGENEREFFLQSNYFNESEQLFLRFSNIRALDKDELYIVVDPERSEIIQSPADGLLTDFRRDGGNFTFTYALAPRQKGLTMPSIVYDEEEVLSRVGSYQEDDGSQTIYIPYSPRKHGTGPVKLKIKDYPARIYGDIEIIIK